MKNNSRRVRRRSRRTSHDEAASCESRSSEGSHSHDSGLDVIENNSVSIPWENSNAAVSDADTGSSAVPKIKVPRLSICENPTTLLSTGCDSFVTFDPHHQTNTSETNGREPISFQSELNKLLRNKPNQLDGTVEPNFTHKLQGLRYMENEKVKNGSKGPAANVTLTRAAVFGKQSSGGQENLGVLKQPNYYSLFTPHKARSSDGSVELKILSEPEERHRARYQTEGSRGAVKDRVGTGFPVVKLLGYNKPVTLQIFIGNESGKVAPSMFYQASRACGKSSPANGQTRIEGVNVIETELVPEKDMTESCDCVGILKERYSDVDQHAKELGIPKPTKKSCQRCRLVFRVCIPVKGHNEVLQVASSPILCTQPPGSPEIVLTSLKNCPAKGGENLFIIGKHFCKESKVIFRDIPSKRPTKNGSPVKPWKVVVEPERDFARHIHIVVKVPPYRNYESLTLPKKVEFVVECFGKRSEPQCLTFYPEQNSAHLNAAVPTVFQIPNMIQNHEGNRQSLSTPIFVVLPQVQNGIMNASNLLQATILQGTNNGTTNGKNKEAPMKAEVPAAKRQKMSMPQNVLQEVLIETSPNLSSESLSSMDKGDSSPPIIPDANVGIFQSIEQNLNPCLSPSEFIQTTGVFQPTISSQANINATSTQPLVDKRPVAQTIFGNDVGSLLNSAPLPPVTSPMIPPTITSNPIIDSALSSSAGIVLADSLSNTMATQNMFLKNPPQIPTSMSIPSLIEMSQNECKPEPVFQPFVSISPVSPFEKEINKCNIQELQMAIDATSQRQKLLSDIIRQESQLQQKLEQSQTICTAQCDVTCFQNYSNQEPATTCSSFSEGKGSREIFNELIRQDSQFQSLGMVEAKSEDYKSFNASSFEKIVENCSSARTSPFNTPIDNSASQIQIMNEIIRQENQGIELSQDGHSTQPAFDQTLTKSQEQRFVNDILRQNLERINNSPDNVQPVEVKSEEYKSFNAEPVLKNENLGPGITLEKSLECTASPEQQIMDEIIRQNGSSPSFAEVVIDNQPNSIMAATTSALQSDILCNTQPQYVQSSENLSQNSLLSMASQQLVPSLTTTNTTRNEGNFGNKDLNMTFGNTSTIEEMMRIPDSELLNLINNPF